MKNKSMVLALTLALPVALAIVVLRPHSSAPVAQAQTATRYFPETGHNVEAPFLFFFENHGGLDTFGYPISEAFADPRTGRLVQYFQNMRLEWWPENSDPYKIQPGLVGDQLGMGQPRRTLSQTLFGNIPDCQYFPETGHSVCFEFLKAFQAGGGIDVFGYPIAETNIENGLTVQYFQRGRLEWHPEYPSGYKAAPGPLGSIYFEFAGLPPELLTRVAPISARQERITRLQLFPSMRDSVMGPSGHQVAFLMVRNQYNQPVANARVTLTVLLSSGVQTITMPPTTADGFTLAGFDYSGGRPGEAARLDFTASAGNITRSTITSFMLWH